MQVLARRNAEYIAEMASQLAAIARENDLVLLAYLLKLAALEADERCDSSEQEIVSMQNASTASRPGQYEIEHTPD
jgi:hypothetical protein